MTNRSEVLSHIVELCKTHNLTLAEVQAAFSAVDAGASVVAAEAKSSILSRVFAYLGGTFIFAGIATFIGMHWDDMTVPMRIIVTFGVGFALYLYAVIASGDERVKKAVPALILMACLLQPFGLLVAIDEYFNSGSDPRYATLAVFTFMFVQQGCTFYARRLTSLLFMTVMFGVLVYGNILELLEVDNNIIALTIGASLLCIMYSLRDSVHQPITGWWNLVGGSVLLIALFDLVEDKPYELLFLGAAAGMVYLSVLAKSRMLLFVGVVGMLGYISYFTAEHFMNSTAWPLMLILLGGVFLGVGSLAVRINRKYIKG